MAEQKFTLTLAGGATIVGTEREINTALRNLFGEGAEKKLANFAKGIYFSETHGMIMIDGMDSRHIGNAIAKIIREEPSLSRRSELENLFKEYRNRFEKLLQETE